MPAIFKFCPSEHGSIGCTIGLAPHVTVGAYGENAADALHKAALMASEMQKKLDEHPELQAALAIVPGGGEAVAAFKAISMASKLLDQHGSLEAIERAMPQTASVVKRLLSLF